MGDARATEPLEDSYQGILVLSPTKTFQAFQSLGVNQKNGRGPQLSGYFTKWH